MDIYHNFAKIVNLQSLVRLQCQTCIELSMMDAIGPSFQGFPFVGDFGNIGCCWGYYCNPITANTTAFWLTVKDIISTVVRRSKHTPIRRYPIHRFSSIPRRCFFYCLKGNKLIKFKFPGLPRLHPLHLVSHHLLHRCLQVEMKLISMISCWHV